MKKLVAPASPNSNRPRRAHGQWTCSVQNLVVESVASDVAECISIVPVRREITIPAIAIDHGNLNERDDLLQETAGAPILVSKCNRDRWIGAAIVPTKGANEYAFAELKNDVILQWLHRGRSSGRTTSRRILAPKKSAVTVLKLAGVKVKS